MKHKIAPSLLAADFLNLQREVEMINESDADWLHLDIMDGVFVPNISFGFLQDDVSSLLNHRVPCVKRVLNDKPSQIG